MIKDVKEMSREDIINLLDDWFAKGIITTTKKLGLSKNDIDKKSRKHELSYTYIPKLIFVGNSEEDENFELLSALINGNRIITDLRVRVDKKCRVPYDIFKASMDNTIRRYERNGIIIYID